MKIALIGYGKMGKAIEEIALAQQDDVVLKIGLENLEDFTIEKLQQADVAIEFTDPHSAVSNLEKCFAAGVPVVCGTTGWLQQLARVEASCTEMNGAFIYASNFSIGVNLFFALNEYLARLMSQHTAYDVTLEEVHHTQKKDAPSGTAITLAEQVLASSKTKTSWVNAEAGNPSELSIISKRIGDVPGIHTVKYNSPTDFIEITHSACNRKGFASGALLAAKFLAGKQGIYTMKDVLGL